MRMKLLQIVEPFHRSWSKRDSFPGLHSDSRQYVLCMIDDTYSTYDFLEVLL